MADMLIRRAQDNLVLCDRIASWSGWDKYGRTPVRNTVTGVPRIFAGQKAQLLVCKVRCTFATGDPRASVANFREILRLHEKSRALRFTDREGAVTEAALMDWTEPEPWEDVKAKTIFDVELTLLDPTVRWY